MPTATKSAGSSSTAAILKEVAALARKEKRSQAEVLRDMLREYRRSRAKRDGAEEEYGEAWVMKLVEEVRNEGPMSPEEILRESDRLARYGAARAKKMGIPTDMTNIVRMMHEDRKPRRRNRSRA